MSADGLKLDPYRDPCLCSKRHVPVIWLTEGHHIWPIEYGGDPNGQKVALCANAHYTVHYRHLMPWVALAKTLGPASADALLTVPLKRKREENRFAYGIAVQGWGRMVTGGWKP